MKTIVLDAYCLNPNNDLSWDWLKEIGDYEIYDRTKPEELIARAADADALLINKAILDAHNISQLPKLKYIGVLATGYNVVDTQYAREKGIVVTNIPAYSTMSVAQMVFAHILNITQQVAHYAAENKEGKWTACEDFCYSDTPLTELCDKNIGIVGLGNTGMATARIALAMGMKVLALTSKHTLPEGISAVDKDTLFAQSDIVSLHCPLTEQTHHIVNQHVLKLMKPTSILINTGRGPLIDEQALATALQNKQIRAAGLDVLTTEPPQPNNPLIGLSNCYITPHIAWATAEARQRLMQIAANNLRAFKQGNPTNKVI